MNSAIPKRIIQIWGGGSELPLLGKASAVNIRLLNPDFEYLLFDDIMMRDFIDVHFSEYRDLFESFRIPVQRYDFFRYLAVYKMGGFYFDFDVFLSLGLSDLLNCGCVFPFERLTWSDYLRNTHGLDWEIGNYAFGAAEGHPFLLAIIKNCVRAQGDKEWREAVTRSLPRVLQEELSVIYTTGPGLVSRTLAEYTEAADQVHVLFPKNVCDRNCWNMFGNYGVHLGNGNWRAKHGSWRRRLINILGARNEKRAIRLALEHGPNRSLEYNRNVG